MGAIPPYQIPDYSFKPKENSDYTFSPYTFVPPSTTPYVFPEYNFTGRTKYYSEPKPGVAYGGMPTGVVVPPAAGGATTRTVTGGVRRYGGAQRYGDSPLLRWLADPTTQVGADPNAPTINDISETGMTPTGGGGISRQQIADAITRMVEAARGAQKEIGAAYGAAGGELEKLMQEYAAAAAAQRAGAGRTLQAFGVDPSQLDVGGMSPQDLLVAQRANLVAQKAAQDAAIADRIAAYQTLMGA